MMEYIITKGGPFVILVFIVIILEYYIMKLPLKKSIIDGIIVGIVVTGIEIAFEYYQLITAITVTGIILFLLLVFYVLYYKKAWPKPKESFRGSLIEWFIAVIAVIAFLILTEFFVYLI
ncbi:MAG: hypothetical protein AB1394_16810 [Bacteroidota bacterium]